MRWGHWLLTALLAGAGFVLGDEEGVPLLGALVGYLLGSQWALGARLRLLEQGRAEGTGVSVAPARRTGTAVPSSHAEAGAAGRAEGDAAATAVAIREVAPAVEAWAEATEAEAEGAASAPFAQPPHPAAATATLAAAPPVATPAITDPRQTPPRAPSLLDGLFAAAWGWLTGGNALVRVGLVVLFFGVAFLLRYVAEHTQLSIELRLAGVAAGGLALLGLGWRLRARRPAYALSLQGGGIGIVYLTLFAAMQFYGLLASAPTFAVLVACTAAAGLLGVVQNAQALALLAAVGGFLAPVLVSTGQDDHVVLFSYYLVLDLGILTIAWFRAWRALNLAGFAFTFVIGALWGGLRYRPELFASTEPFLIAFFVLYTAVAVLFALRRPADSSAPPNAMPAPAAVDMRPGWVDGTLVFGVPVVAFPLQAALVVHIRHGMAWSALAVAIFYALLTLALRRRPGLGLLAECYLALAVAFGTVAIPLGFEAGTSAPLWALEGAALVWVSARQNRWPGWAFGLLVQFGAGLLRLDELAGGIPAERGTPFLNLGTLTDALLAAAGVAAACWLWRSRPRYWWPAVSRAALGWGLAWWLAAGARESLWVAPAAQAAGWWLAFLALGVLAASGLHRRIGWRALLAPLYLHGSLLAATLVLLTLDAGHPFARLGWLGWPLVLAAHALALYRLGTIALPGLAWLHAAGLWLLVALVGVELPYAIEVQAGWRGAWAPAATGAWLAAAVAGLARYRGSVWPLGAQPHAYRGLALAPLPVLLTLWWLAALADPGAAPPLPWLPLLNPLDLAVIVALGALYAWRRAVVAGEVWGLPLLRSWLTPALAALVFVSGNATLLRAVHHYAGVPWTLPDLWESRLAQATLAVVWALAGVGLMLVAGRRAQRTLWLAGAGLLGVVVLKLFAVDLSGRDTLERIVAFLAVGGLLLLVGWFAPVPPRAAAQDGPPPSG